MARIVNTLENLGDVQTIFIGGSSSIFYEPTWKQDLLDLFDDYDDSLVFVQPKRIVWNEKIELGLACPKFKKQIEWELSILNECDYIWFHFIANDTHETTPLLEMALQEHEHSCEFWASWDRDYCDAKNLEKRCDRSLFYLFDEYDDVISQMKRDVELDYVGDE